MEPARLGTPDRQDPARAAQAGGEPAEHRRSSWTSARPWTTSYVYRVVDALDAVAAETGRTVPQVALNWLLQRPSVSTVIIGARNEDQLRQNLGAVGWNLTARQQVADPRRGQRDARAYPYWHQQGFTERNPPPVQQMARIAAPPVQPYPARPPPPLPNGSYLVFGIRSA